MIYHQILTIRTLLNKVCYRFQHILATWCIHWHTNVYPNGSPFLLPYLGYNMTYEPTIHILIFDNLFTKHSTHIFQDHW